MHLYFPQTATIVQVNTVVTEADVRFALSKVKDPEINKPVTDLGMVKSITINSDQSIDVGIYLTVASCPLRTEIVDRVVAAVSDLSGAGQVRVELDVMNDEQRTQLRTSLRGNSDHPVIPFAQPDNLTRMYAIASGKGGVGKSSITVNLAISLQQRGLQVGIIDADIYGHSVPSMLGSHAQPTQVEKMIMPPCVHGIKVISIAQFTKGNAPILWRGPMLHRALQQFLADVFWGDLDILLIDLPPGTGDMAISVAQLLPNAEIVVVTTPQSAATDVAERAGTIATQTRQKVIGVIENMSYYVLPDGSQTDIFGTGGGQIVAERLTSTLGTNVPLLGQIPLEPHIRQAGDAGTPFVLEHPDSAAAQEFNAIAEKLAVRQRGLVGLKLGIDTTRRR